MIRKTLLFATSLSLLLASPGASPSSPWGGDAAFANTISLAMERIGARTERRQSTMEQRGQLCIPPAEVADFFDSVKQNGAEVGFYYTDTVEEPSADYPMGSPNFNAGDLMHRTDFVFKPEVCWSKDDENEVLKCKDKERKSYLFLKYKKKTGCYQMKTYVRKITCDLPPADCSDPNSGLTIDPNVGKHIDFKMKYNSISGGEKTITGLMKRCDWKRGKKRTATHIKCPTLCGGPPKAPCGTEYCIDDLGFPAVACRP